MKRTTFFAFCLVFFTISGCTHTELTRRYKSKNFATAPLEKEYVLVSAFVMTPPQAPPNTLLSQINTPEGQAALISKMAEWAKSPEELYKALTVSEKGRGEGARTIDKTVFKKRVVFSVEKKPPGKEHGDLTPADRINALTVSLSLPKKEEEIKQLQEIQARHEEDVTTKKARMRPLLRITNPTFEDWDKFDTKFQTVDLGKLKRQQHAAAAGSLEVGPAVDVKVPVSGTANISRETTIDEEINLQQRFILMSGAIKDNKKKAVIFQESQVGYDLAGNFSIDFTIKINNRNRSGFVILGPLEKDGKQLDQKDVTIDFGSVIYPVSSKPVKCDLATDYTIRHVRQLPLYDRYDRELAEGFHRVVFISGKYKGEDVELITKSELRTIIYQIVLGEKTYLYLGMPVEDPLKKEESVKDPEEPTKKNPLRFLSLEDAKTFLALLKESSSKLKKTKKIKIGKYHIYRGKNDPINKEDIPNLHIRAKQLND